MIYRCEHCNEEMNLMNGAKYCPLCGSEIQPIDLEVRVSDLYNSGKTVKQIASELRMTEIVIGQVLSKAAVDEKVNTAGLIQTEYESAIADIIANDWDGKLKTIKKSVPNECTYITINYYVRKLRRANAAARRQANREKITEIRRLLNDRVDVETIVTETQASIYMVERILVEEIGKNRALADAYTNSDYEAQILEIMKNPDWDGKLHMIKENLPEEVTYTNIRATIAKYQ